MIDKPQPSAIPDRTFIPAKPKIDIYGAERIFRVCAYCRVSTDNDAQLSSFELQQAHYRQLMETHPNWDLKHIYADEGISGTSLKKRDDFNRMITACESGEYDLIVTKSVSRFARNLVDCVSLVRKLKRQKPPVGVYFETDNLNTLSEDSELMLSFLATFAQEESVKKSESMNWSLQQRFRDGKLLTPALLGYERPRDSAGHYIKYAPLQIVESEAAIVRFIFDAFLSGKSMKEISDLLTDIKCPTKTGRTEWNEGSISYILRNERYCGNILTWKTFTADMYEHKHKRNRQDRDQYLYTGKHDPIISPETFEAAQVLMENRKHHVRGGFPIMHVIDAGIFRGYIPINHHWINEDPATYYQASKSVSLRSETLRIRRSLFSVFNFDGYQVVRGQFITARSECPCISIANNRIVFNAHCARKFSDVSYIQLLLHPSERKLAIRPCRSDATHRIRWRPDSDRPIAQKTIRCPHFGNALYQIMEWNPDFLYRIRGTWAFNGSEQIIVFNLSNAVPTVYLASKSDETEPIVKHRVDLCPDEWNDSFGDDFYDYSLQNSFYFLDKKTNWKSQMSSVAVPGQQLTILSDMELENSMMDLRKKVGSRHGE